MSGFEGALIAAGVSAAVGIGSSLIINALTPAQVVKSGGLSDLSVPKSNYGAVIPMCWGNIKLAGNLLWSTTKREVTEENRQGGKGGPTVISRETTYYGNFAVLLAYTPIRSAERLSRLWLNGKLVFDGESTDPDTQSASAEFLATHLRFYTGASDQTPDPLLQNAYPIQSYDYGLPHDPTERANALGALGLPPNLNHIPAYQYKCYVVLENLPLADYGNQIPVVKAEVLFNTDNSLETVVTDICNLAGINNIDTTGIQNIFVPGFYLDRITSASDALKTLQQAYFFDIIKSGNLNKFLTYSQGRDIIQIPLSDLAASSGGSSRPKTFELPKPDLSQLTASVEINYIDQQGSHETGIVEARSQVVGSTRSENYTFPIVMSAESAGQIAHNLLFRFYLEAIAPIELTLPPKYCYLEVGDRLEVYFYDEPYILQITKIQLGANLLLKLETKVVEAANLNNLVRPPAEIQGGGYNPPLTQTNTIATSGNTILEVMDIHLVKDSDRDHGVYVSAYGGSNWRECSVYVSTDDSNYYNVAALTRGTIGTLAGNIDAISTTILVNLNSGFFESVSTADLDLGLNKLLVGEEILQFTFATLNGDNYELSGFRRGIRGTEWAQNHSIGERVVLLTGAGAKIAQIEGSGSDLDQVRYFKAVSPGQTLDRVSPVVLTIEGNSLNPYAAVNLSSTVDPVGNITINWDRRDRHAGDAITYRNLPLSEFEEKWEIEILDPSNNVVRTIETLTNQTVYRNLTQNTDFGGTPNSITVRIYQISAEVGRGYVASAILNPASIVPPVSVSEIVPDTITIGRFAKIKGSGLSAITNIEFDGRFIEFDIISDEEINFRVAHPASEGQYEELYLYNGNPQILGSFNYETTQKLNVLPNRYGYGFIGFKSINTNYTPLQEDEGIILLVDTNSSDITITFDFNTLEFTEHIYQVHVRNMGLNKVILTGATNNFVLARSTELVGQYDSASFYYEFKILNGQFVGHWHGIGAL